MYYINSWDEWLSLAAEQPLTICAYSAMIEHLQIVSSYSAANDNQSMHPWYGLTLKPTISKNVSLSHNGVEIANADKCLALFA